MTKDTALRLALEALENLGNHDRVCPQWPTYAEPKNYPKCNCGYDQAITAIKAALEAKDEPWSPVSIGVDVTSKGAHVIGIYALDADTSQIFYAKHYPAPQRTWVGLTDKDWNRSKHNQDFQKGVDWAEEMLKGKNT